MKPITRSRVIALSLLFASGLTSCALTPYPTLQTQTERSSDAPLFDTGNPDDPREFSHPSRSTVVSAGSKDGEIRNSQSDSPEERAFQERGLAIRKKLAAIDLAEKDAWWRRIELGDPHKYLLPIILARLSLPERYDPQESWDILLKMDADKRDLYHFRGPLDVRIFFTFRNVMPLEVRQSYRTQLDAPRVLEWSEGGTENHMFMQRAAGLALMDGSGFPVGDPATAATNEAWLRSELNKFLSIGQGEFHSSIYYGYSIGGLLALHDFAQDPELRKLAAALLDWYATNMALRLSWGTAGGAESRGFDRATWDSGLTAVAWQWWGDDPDRATEMNDRHAWLALPAALSSYRPPEHLRAVARKEVPLPFEARASHPSYYSYSADNHLWETFYVTEDYSLGTLLEPARTYRVEGTIRAQYATYKLVARDPEGDNNAVVSLGGTYHGPQATGRSPGDQLVQKRGAVIFQLILNSKDLDSGVPPRSHLVLPDRYGAPRRHGDWYIWKVENIWLAARPFADRVERQTPVSEEYEDYQALVAHGVKTAWIADIGRIEEYPTLEALKRGLNRTRIDEEGWDTEGTLSYRSLDGDRISMTYELDGAIADATINGDRRGLSDWPVLESPYINLAVYDGILKIDNPLIGGWQLRTTLQGPQWSVSRPVTP